MAEGDEKRMDGMALFMSLGMPSSGAGGRGIEAARGSDAKTMIEVARPSALARASRATGGRGVPLLPTTNEATDVAPLEPRDPEGFAGVLARTDRLLGRTYLEGLSARWPVLGEGRGSWEDFFTEGRRQVSLFRVRHLVFRPDEDPRERLKPFYLGIHGLAGNPSVFFVLDSDYDPLTRRTTVALYLGIRAHTRDREATAGQFRDLAQGYFPGTDFSSELQGEETEDLQRRILRHGQCEIAVVSAIPSAKRDAKGKPLRQGLESLVDVMLGHSYTAILVAQAVPPEAAARRRRVLENLYTELSPAQKVSQSVQTSESKAIGLSYSKSTGRSETDSYSVTHTRGTSWSETESTGHSSSYTSGSSSSSSFSGSQGGSSSFGSSSSSTSSSSYSHSVTQGVSESTGETRGKSVGVSVTATEGSSETDTRGITRGVTLETTNKNVAELIARLEAALERMRCAEGFGLWECAAYFVADNATNALLAANAYKALVCGDESDGERAYLSLWDGAAGARAYDGTKTPRQAALLASILNGEHPTLRGGREGSPYWEMTPGSLVSGKDLPWFLPLPMQSVPGLVVDEMAAFERSVLTVDTTHRGARRTLRLGDVYHLGRRDGAHANAGQGGGRAVELDLDAFTGHCLVTGATGSGKSNTVGVLLDGFVRAGVPFLAIEPAKGEYRNDFRWVRNADGSPISVFSTHPCVGQLLRINPFRFPASVHVLEHIDRLLSVFSSCWEMTEAQPMFLKKAVERAYVDCGWNLFHSCFTRDGEPSFPTFARLIGCLRTVIQESDYDERAKGIYTGALVTRVESLAGGLLGAVFRGTQDIPAETLFASNCIVDLSRLGSAETKALIMGMLVMALSEYHADEALRTGIRNAALRHVTVLEEAHNLLRNANTVTEGNGATVAKAIETLGNAIAEMRTYGEGFLVVDQSPGALDICATRNTNTKIVMRLPEQQDCEAMAKALALDDWQKQEIAKLNPGVAVVFQNTWRAPVLTLVDRAPEHRAEKACTPEERSTPDAYRALQSEIAHRLAVWAALDDDKAERAAQDLQAWVAGPARKEICERLAPGAWDAQQAAIAAIEARLARAHEAEKRGAALFGALAKDEAEPLQEVPPVPLSEAAIREASARLARFFGELTEKTRLDRLGGTIVELLGLQTYWRELAAGVAWARGDRKPAGATLSSEGQQRLGGFLLRMVGNLGLATGLSPETATLVNRNVAAGLLAHYLASGCIASGGTKQDVKDLRALRDACFPPKSKVKDSTHGN